MKRPVVLVHPVDAMLVHCRYFSDARQLEVFFRSPALQVAGNYICIDINSLIDRGKFNRTK